MHPINIGFIFFGIVFMLGGIVGIIKPNYVQFHNFPDNKYVQGSILVIFGLIILILAIMFQIPE